MDQPKYYFASGTEQRGPYVLSEILALGLRPDTLVWREGMSDWQRLDSVPELLAPPPAAPMLMSAPAPLAPPGPAPLAPLMQSQQLAYRGFDPGAVQPASGMAIASLVLGIIAALTLCGGYLGIIGLPCSILAVIFGFNGKGKANRGEAGGRGMALAGIILGFVHIGILVLIVLALFGLRAAMH